MQMNQETSLKVLKQSFKILKENIYRQNPNFDTNHVEQAITDQI